jgi:hypothetical protein
MSPIYIQPQDWLPSDLAPLFEQVMRELPAFPSKRQPEFRAKKTSVPRWS